MKKLFTFIVAVICSMSMWAKVRIGDCYYLLSEYGAILQTIDDRVDSLDIPDTIVYNNRLYPVIGVGIKKDVRISQKALAYVTIPESVIGIYPDIFANTKLYNDTANWENGVLYIDRCLVNVSGNVSGHVDIKENTRIIAHRAFSDCPQLTSVTIPKQVKYIQNGAFDYSGMYNDKANWQDGALYIDNCLIRVDESFTGDFKAKDGTRLLASAAFFGCKNLTSVVLPECVTRIQINEFVGCESLKSITIPKQVQSIGGWAFSGCKSIESIDIPDGVSIIEAATFDGCTALKSVVIPANVEQIKLLAFRDCHSLESLVIPLGVKRIDENCFENCKSLTTLELPSTLESISDFAFMGCESLKSITLPEGLKTIGRSTFYKCQSIEMVKLPSSIERIDACAFHSCQSLKTVRYNGTMEQWEKIEKGTNIWSEVPARTVICTDGELKLR